MKKYFKPMVFMFIILLFANPVFAVFVLPDPNTQIPGAYPGDNVATLHDNFYGYSAKLLDAMGYPGFDYSTGTGGLDLIIYTGAGTKNKNQEVGADGPDPGSKGDFYFEDPMADPAGGPNVTFYGWWGLNDQNNDGTADAVNGPVLVDNVLNYLHATFGATINVPVFLFDMNQEGDYSNLYISGQVYIYDPATSKIVKSWAFDDLQNDAYDPGSPVLAIGNLVIPKNGATYPFDASEILYEVDHNKGSGKLDFIGIAPTMDLSLYTGHGYLFVTEFRLGAEGNYLNDGFEELFLSGTVAPQVPEPASFLLFGAGLTSLWILARKRFKK